MEKATHLKSIILSFNPKFYKRVIGQPFLRTITYLLVLILLVSVPLTFRAAKNYNQLTKVALKWVNKYVPEEITDILPGPIKIENGVVSSEIPQPHIYQSKYGYVFILDTTGTIASLDNYENGVFLSKNKVLFKSTKNKSVELKEHNLSQVKSFYAAPGDIAAGEILKIKIRDIPYSITSENIQTFFDKFFAIFAIFAFAGIFIWQLIAKFFQMIVFSLIALIVNSVAQTGLKYKDLLNIGAYCVTPVICLAAVASIIPKPIPGFPFIYLAIYATYLVVSITQIQKA